MKKFLFIVIFVAAVVALFEQSKPVPNIYITIVCVIVFMFGMMRLSSKLPSKNSNSEDENVK